MRNFRDLRVWQEAHGLTLAVYGATKRYPADERFGLTSQSRRAAASICANIAEGCRRRTNPDFARFIQIALGSASELEYHLLLAADLHILDHEAHQKMDRLVTSVQRMLVVFLRRLTGSRAASR